MEQWRTKELQLATLRNELQAFDEEELTYMYSCTSPSISTCSSSSDLSVLALPEPSLLTFEHGAFSTIDLNITTSPSVSFMRASDVTLSVEQPTVKFEFPELMMCLAPTTPSYRLAKSVLKHTTLKTIDEEVECGFAYEFGCPLPTHTPLSLMGREQGVEQFSPAESTIAVSPFSFMQASGQGFSGDKQSISTDLTVNAKQHDQTPSVEQPTNEHSQTPSTEQPVVRFEFPLMIRPAPTTPSYRLAKSVLKHTTLKTIDEELECDFANEFCCPLPTHAPLSLIEREQGVKQFITTELTVTISPFSFMQASGQSSSGDKQSISTDLTVNAKQLHPDTEKALTNNSECQVSPEEKQSISTASIEQLQPASSETPLSVDATPFEEFLKVFSNIYGEDEQLASTDMLLNIGQLQPVSDESFQPLGVTSIEQSLTADIEQSSSTEQPQTPCVEQPTIEQPQTPCVEQSSSTDVEPQLSDWELICKEVTSSEDTLLDWADRDEETSVCLCNWCRVNYLSLEPLPNNPTSKCTLSIYAISPESFPAKTKGAKEERRTAEVSSEDTCDDSKRSSQEKIAALSKPDLPIDRSNSSLVSETLSSKSGTGFLRGERSRSINKNSPAFHQLQRFLSKRATPSNKAHTESAVTLGRRVATPTSHSTFTPPSKQGRGSGSRSMSAHEGRRGRRGTTHNIPTVHMSGVDADARTSRGDWNLSQSEKAREVDRSRGVAPEYTRQSEPTFGTPTSLQRQGRGGRRSSTRARGHFTPSRESALSLDVPSQTKASRHDQPLEKRDAPRKSSVQGCGVVRGRGRASSRSLH